MDNIYFKEERPLRELLHMQTAMSWATRSLCKRLRVGAVITNAAMDEILAFGYNGPGKGLEHDRCRSHMPGNCGCVHAESNAVAKCPALAYRGVLFCTTCPCELCAQLIARKGIDRVFYISPYRDSSGEQLLSQMGIKAQQMITSELMEGLMALTMASQSYEAWSGRSSPSTVKLMASTRTTGHGFSASLIGRIKENTGSSASLPSPFSFSRTSSTTPPSTSSSITPNST